MSGPPLRAWIGWSAPEFTKGSRIIPLTQHGPGWARAIPDWRLASGSRCLTLREVINQGAPGRALRRSTCVWLHAACSRRLLKRRLLKRSLPCFPPRSAPLTSELSLRLRVSRGPQQIELVWSCCATAEWSRPCGSRSGCFETSTLYAVIEVAPCSSQSPVAAVPRSTASLPYHSLVQSALVIRESAAPRGIRCHDVPRGQAVQV